MTDLISRQAALAEAYDVVIDGSVFKVVQVETLYGLPTIDAVPVVRCKDCKHYREGKVLSPQNFCFRLKDRNGEAIGYNFAEDDFCSYGKRSEE